MNNVLVGIDTADDIVTIEYIVFHQLKHNEFQMIIYLYTRKKKFNPKAHVKRKQRRRECERVSKYLIWLLIMLHLRHDAITAWNPESLFAEPASSRRFGNKNKNKK